MKKIQYQDILKQALLLTWRNKFLWFFGFLTFLGSITSNADFLGDNTTNQTKMPTSVSSFIEQHPWIFFGLIVLLIIVAITLFLLRLIATAAIIKSADNIELYKQLSLKAIFIEAKLSLWKLFLLELIISLSLGLIIALLSFPITYLFFLKAKLFAFLMLATAILIVLPLLVLAYYLRKYAYFYIVLGNFNIKASLEMAYTKFTTNIKESLLMGVVTFATGLLSIIIVPAIILTLALVLAPFGILAYFLSAKIGVIITLAIGIIFAIVILLTVFSWYSCFLQTAWLLFFQQISFEKIDEEKVPEKKVEEKVPSPEVA